MEENDQKLKEYFEILVQNVEKGDTYSITFKDNPEPYTGIPMIHRLEADKNKFIFQVIRPEKYKGVHECKIQDIEKMEKR